MAAARRLRPPLRAATFETLIGLLACTGLRVGEAIRLDRDDVDPHHRRADRPRFEVRQVARGAAAREHRRARWTITAQRRDQLLPGRHGAQLLRHHARHRLAHPTVYAPFRALLEHAGHRASLAAPARAHCTICATLSRSRRCSAGIATAPTSRRGCRCCRPTSGTSTRPRPTGICPRRRSCSRSPPSASSSTHGGTAMTALAPTLRGVLHRPAARPAGRQPAHDRRLPRHLPAAARLRRTSRPASRPPSSSSRTSTRR